MEKKPSVSIRVTLSCDDVSRGNEIIKALKDRIKKYGYCSFNRLFELANNGFDQDRTIGWDNLDNCLINQNSLGIGFVLPPIKEVPLCDSITLEEEK